MKLYDRRIKAGKEIVRQRGSKRLQMVVSRVNLSRNVIEKIWRASVKRFPRYENPVLRQRFTAFACRRIACDFVAWRGVVCSYWIRVTSPKRSYYLNEHVCENTRHSFERRTRFRWMDSISEVCARDMHERASSSNCGEETCDVQNASRKWQSTKRTDRNILQGLLKVLSRTAIAIYFLNFRFKYVDVHCG